MGELELFLVKINSGLASKDRVFLDKGQNKRSKVKNIQKCFTYEQIYPSITQKIS